MLWDRGGEQIGIKERKIKKDKMGQESRKERTGDKGGKGKV